ncbi:MAG: flagellar hook-basal body complex protein FliE [Deltaproteobacteria bacterium]|nr:flagellar hook-basal body complex protein FliE [Deltaproteobacteria bacterium]
MEMNPINPLGAKQLPAGDSKTAVKEMSDTFSRMFEEVNGLQHEADRKIEEFATSQEKDIHGTMIALQKADLSLRLFMQVRSKLTSAYQEIMRMQM